MLTGLNCERLLHKQPRDDRRLIGLVGDYAVPNVSAEILRLILSYTDFVRCTLWHQY